MPEPTDHTAHPHIRRRRIAVVRATGGAGASRACTMAALGILILLGSILIIRQHTGDFAAVLSVALPGAALCCLNVRLQSDQQQRNHRLGPEHDAGTKSIGRGIAPRSHQAHFDHLTGLLNRKGVRLALEEIVEQHRADSHNGYAVFLINVDRIKCINESLGHDAGDVLLRAVAHRLRHFISELDPTQAFSADRLGARMGRLSGDEFLVIIQSADAPQLSNRTAQTLLEHLNTACEVAGRTIHVSAGIGLTTSELNYTQAEEILRDIEIAMHQAKILGRAGCVMFNPSMHEQARRLLQLETDLRCAADRGEIGLLYQPIVRLDSGAVVGFEALSRWNHPTLGSISPDEFIRVAEDSGLIDALGEWVLQNACGQLARWRGQNPDDFECIEMNINVSRRQLLIPGFPDLVERTIADCRLPFNRVHLEITETAMMTRPREVCHVLGDLRRLGVQVDMDDFGTGYSSLHCLHEFPINILKIDRSFITNLRDRIDYAAVVHAIVTLAHNLGIRLIAEGIEDVQQVVSLQALDCDFGQGYYFGKPLSADDARKYTLEHGTRVRHAA